MSAERFSRTGALRPALSSLRGLGPERSRRALDIDLTDARAAGALGFLGRILVQASLPHRRCAEHEFERTNGRLTLHLHAPPSVGLPYGSYPRLILAWLNTEAVRTRSPHLKLGPTFTSFMSRLDLSPVTGKRGTSRRLRDQLHRLFSTSIRWSESDRERGVDQGRGYMIAHRHQLWWSPRDPDDPTATSTLSLNAEFYTEIVRHAVPIDLRALAILKRSALALDIYAWLTYRLGYLTRPTLIPWPALEAQFGADYARPRDFRRKFLLHLADVLQVYPAARVTRSADGLLLRPSPTHVPRRPRRPRP